MRRHCLIILSVFLFFIFSCSDDNPTGSGTPGWTFDEFVHVDTNVYIMMRLSTPSCMSTERMVNWEVSLGEPFIDINGDGNYDALIDSFIIDWDSPDNQDLNFDSKYSGTNPIYWTEGVPFDDLDGDGVFRSEGDSYADGVPFTDYDNDSIFDGSKGPAHYLTRFSQHNGIDGNLWFNLISDSSDSKIINAKSRYVSDSGVVYELPVITNLYYDEDFCITDSNLIHYSNRYILPVLDKGTAILSDSSSLIIKNNSGDEVIAQRMITIDTTVTVQDHAYSGVLMVRFDLENETNTYIFSRELGLLEYTNNGKIGMAGYRLSFRLRYPDADSLIFPMTRIEP